MTEASPDAAYVVALVEMTGSGERDGGDEDEDSDGPWIGACAVDCAAGRFLVGAWRDDAALTGARATLAALRPVEIVAPPTGSARRASPPSETSRRTPACAGGGGDDAAARDDTAAGALELFRRGGYFSRNDARGPSTPSKRVPSTFSERATTGESTTGALPPVLAALAAESNGSRHRDAALGAFGAMTRYLRDAMLDEDLVPLGRVEKLPGPRDAARSAHGGSCAWTPRACRPGDSGGLRRRRRGLAAAHAGPLRQRGRTQAAAQVGHASAAERRRRQGAPEAVADLRGAGLDAMGRARAHAQGADMERAVARLVAWRAGAGATRRTSCCTRTPRAAPAGFLAALDAVKAAAEAANAFDAATRGRLASPALRLVTPAGDGADGAADGAADDPTPGPDRTIRKQSEKHSCSAARLAAIGGVSMRRSTRRSIFSSAPSTGTRRAPRARRAQTRRRRCRGRRGRAPPRGPALDAWLPARARPRRRRDAAAFASANKDTHLVEVPDRLASRVPGTWSREGKRKGFERFDAPDLARLRVERADAEEARELALAACCARSRWPSARSGRGAPPPRRRRRWTRSPRWRWRRRSSRRRARTPARPRFAGTGFEGELPFFAPTD